MMERDSRNHPPFSTLRPRRILVRGVNWLGDAVMSTPALLRLRERFPDAHITLLTPAKLRDLWLAGPESDGGALRNPALDGVITFHAGEGVFSVSRKLRAGNFDFALVLPNSPRSALEVWLANIPRRVGYARPWRNCFLTGAIAPRTGAVEMHKRSVVEIKTLIAEAHPDHVSPIHRPPTTCTNIFISLRRWARALNRSHHAWWSHRRKSPPLQKSSVWT